MKIDDIAQSEGIWGSLSKDNPDIVLKSTMRFFRNVDGYLFPHKLTKKKREQINRFFVDCIMISEIYSDFAIYPVDKLQASDRKILNERNLLEDEQRNGGTLVIGTDQSYYFVLCDANHMDFVAEKSGLCFDELYSFSKSLLNGMARKIDFSFSPKYGYLTANPKNAGAALHLCCTVHLPGLAITGKINEVVAELVKNGFLVRSSRIEGYYEIFNRTSLGIVEKELFESAVSSFRRLVQTEREMREAEYRKNKTIIEDKVWRSYGILMYSRCLSLYEAFELLSSLRLGVSLGFLEFLTIKTINTLLYFVQDHHLKRRLSGKNSNQNLDEVRASFLREFLKEVM